MRIMSEKERMKGRKWRGKGAQRGKVNECRVTNTSESVEGSKRMYLYFSFFPSVKKKNIERGEKRADQTRE